MNFSYTISFDIFYLMHYKNIRSDNYIPYFISNYKISIPFIIIIKIIRVTFILVIKFVTLIFL